MGIPTTRSARLPYLDYLNLYATSITDEGLQHLTGLPRLRALYLWQTEVTPAGAERLRAALPDLDVNLGVAMPAEAADAAERPRGTAGLGSARSGPGEVMARQEPLSAALVDTRCAER